MSGSVLTVIAHPDDEALIAGGTLALAARAGAKISIVSLTRGEQGPIASPALADRLTLPTVRERELAASAAVLNASFVRCLSLPDGEVPWCEREPAVTQVRTLISELRPDVILTFGEDGLYWHPDHIACGEIVTQAVAGCGFKVEVLAAAWDWDTVPALTAEAARRGLPNSMWDIDPDAFGTDEAPIFTVDIREVVDVKLAALRAHRTQLDDEHLFTHAPADLLRDFLGTEPWAGTSATRLQEILDGRPVLSR